MSLSIFVLKKDKNPLVSLGAKSSKSPVKTSTTRGAGEAPFYPEEVLLVPPVPKSSGKAPDPILPKASAPRKPPSPPRPGPSPYPGQPSNRDQTHAVGAGVQKRRRPPPPEEEEEKSRGKQQKSSCARSAESGSPPPICDRNIGRRARHTIRPSLRARSVADTF